VEAILALEPDVVFAGNTLQEDAITQLSEVGIKVVATEATSYEQIFESISLVGQLTCTVEKADEVIALMKEKESQVVAMAQEYEGEPITAYYVLGAGEYGNWTAGPGSLIDDMFKMLGIETITDVDGATAWMEFSLETLVAEDPAVMILPDSEYLTVEALCEMEGYKELTACKEGTVAVVGESVTQRPSVRIVDGLEEIYNAVYGQ
jgi:iron complex transport system substrate-binding protein